MSLVPTLMVRFNSEEGNPDRWVPREIEYERSLTEGGWQIPFFENKKTGSLETEYTVPANLVIGGSVRRANLPSSVTVSNAYLGRTGGTVSVDPTCRGEHPSKLDVITRNLYLGSEVGQISMRSTFPGGSPFSSTLPRRGGLPTVSSASPPGENRVKQYAVRIPASRDLTNALKRGYDQLKDLHAFATILFTAGVGVVSSAAGSALRRFLVTLGRTTLETRLQAEAYSGTLNIVRGITADGDRIDQLSEEDLPSLRTISGSVQIEPPTAELKDAFQTDNINSEIGYGRFSETDDMLDVGVGFTGPFVAIRAPPDRALQGRTPVASNVESRGTVGTDENTSSPTTGTGGEPPATGTDPDVDPGRTVNQGFLTATLPDEPGGGSPSIDHLSSMSLGDVEFVERFAITAEPKRGDPGLFTVDTVRGYDRGIRNRTGGITMDRRFTAGDSTLDVLTFVGILPGSVIVVVEHRLTNPTDRRIVLETSRFSGPRLGVGTAGLQNPTGTYRFHVSGHGTERFADHDVGETFAVDSDRPFVTAFDDDARGLTTGFVAPPNVTHEAVTTRIRDRVRVSLLAGSIAVPAGETRSVRLAISPHDNAVGHEDDTVGEARGAIEFAQSAFAPQ